MQPLSNPSVGERARGISSVRRWYPGRTAFFSNLNRQAGTNHRRGEGGSSHRYVTESKIYRRVDFVRLT